MLTADILYLSLPIYMTFAFRKYKKGETLWHQMLYFLLYIYFINVIRLTLFPIPFDKDYIEMARNRDLQFINHHFIPFTDIWSSIKNTNLHNLKWTLYVLGGNLALLVPFGILYPLLKSKVTLKKIAAYSFLIFFCIESTQLFISLILQFNYRSFSVDDLILNTIGGILGYLAVLFFKHFKNRIETLNPALKTNT